MTKPERDILYLATCYYYDHVKLFGTDSEIGLLRESKKKFERLIETPRTAEQTLKKALKAMYRRIENAKPAVKKRRTTTALRYGENCEGNNLCCKEPIGIG